MSRKQEILETLAQMLESHPGQRITTAALAQALGVSEAALYRHFPSKAKMFEGLIEFVEDTLFSRITRILEEEKQALQRCESILLLLLSFAGKNPGLCRLLTGDALTGENERLRARCGQVFGRMETQLKQILREAEVREGLVVNQSATAAAALMLALAEGRIVRFVRSGFKDAPTMLWQEQWAIVSVNLLSESKFTDLVSS